VREKVRGRRYEEEDTRKKIRGRSKEEEKMKFCPAD
jgi:hypothetical protein